METDKTSTTIQTALTGFTIFEKVSELRWVLQFAIFLLFADLAMLGKTGRGIIEWSASTEQLLSNAGTLAVSLLMFGLFVSIILPVLIELVRRLTITLVIYGTPQFLRRERVYTREVGYVRPYELHERALKENSSFLLGIYREHREENEKSRVARLETGGLIFTVLLLAISDFMPHALGMHGMSLIQETGVKLGEQGGVILFYAALASFASLMWTWFTGWGEGWIYYPPLYEEIMDKKRSSTLPPVRGG